MVGLGFPVAWQSRIVGCLCLTVLSLGSICHSGGTEMIQTFNHWEVYKSLILSPPFTTSWAVKFAAAAMLLAMQVYEPLWEAFSLKKRMLLLKTLFWTWISDGGSNGRLSFSHLMSMGMSPEEMVQDTWERSSSFRSPSNANGEIFGGSEMFLNDLLLYFIPVIHFSPYSPIALRNMWAVAVCPCLLKAVQEYFMESDFSNFWMRSVPLVSGTGLGPFRSLAPARHSIWSIG